MSSPRIRRLESDYDRMMRRFAGFPLIRIEPADGLPPEKYIVKYNIKGLYAEPDGTLKERTQHRLEINLTLGYPRRQPQCKLLTPIFHPNITEASVCSGDFYAASEGLDDLVIRIGRMIAYQEYNVKSPLNGIAAKWAEKNDRRLPVDSRELAPPGSSQPAMPASPPPQPGAQRIIIDPNDPPISHSQVADGSLRVTRDDQANAIRTQIDEAWGSQDFDKVEHLLKAYTAISKDQPSDLRQVKESVRAERYLSESSRTCESAIAKIESKTFSTAMAELDSLPTPPKAPSSEYEVRLSEAATQIEQAKCTAADKWVLSVRNDVWQLCQGDKDSYARIASALDELKKIPLANEARITICDQIVTEARRTRAAYLDKQIERASAINEWTVVLALSEELAAVDPGSVPARTHHDNAIRHMQENLADEITAAWTAHNLDSTQGLLEKYVRQWQKLPAKLQHLQLCLDMERFLAKFATAYQAAQGKAEKKDFAGAVSILDGLPSAPDAPKKKYTQQMAAAMGKNTSLRKGAIADWITVIEGNVCGACSGTAQNFEKVDSIIAETRKIPLSADESRKLQERLRQKAAQERSRVLNSQISAACEQRNWSLVMELCDELQVLEPKSKVVSRRKKEAKDGRRLDAGVLKAGDFFSAGQYVECVNLCEKLSKEHDVQEFRFQARPFKGTLPQLRETVHKNEAEFLGAVDNLRKAIDSHDWNGVTHWAGAARKLKPKEATVAGLMKEAHKKRAQVKRRATFRAIRRAVVLAVFCVIAFFVYRYARQWHTFNSALAEADETTAIEVAQQIKWFYGPAEGFISARGERALLKTAQIEATDIIGHMYDGHWLASQRAVADGQKAWENREFDTAAEKWREARKLCRSIVCAAVPLTIAILPDLADAFVRLAAADNRQLVIERGASLSLRATPGHYRMDVEHPDYEHHHEKIDIATNENEEVYVYAQLTPLPGKLLIQCVPDAIIFKNGEVLGKTGVALALPAGGHIVEITAKHYESVQKNVFIDPNGEVNLDLELDPLPGRLIVKCDPVATVLLDGHEIGKTGGVLTLPAGGHIIEITAKHYESVQKNIVFDPNGEVNLDLKLEPLPVRLIVKCDPVATVLLDGHEVGKTDEDMAIPVGEYRLTVTADGYKSESFSVTVCPARDVKLDTTLELLPLSPGKLRLSCTPTAQVFVGGELVGVTGEPISLTEGKHKVELVADGYAKRTLTVRIPLGRDVEWHGALNIIPGALLIEANIPAMYGKLTVAPTAKLTIGDVSKRVTLPHRENGLAPGYYKVQVDVQGYERIPQDSVSISSREWTRMQLTIVPQSATICFVPDPPGTKLKIYVESLRRGVAREKKIGEGGEKIWLMPLVQHTLIFRANGYKTSRKRLRLPCPGRHYGDMKIELQKRTRSRRW